jgi:hypothetical protein
MYRKEIAKMSQYGEYRVNKCVVRFTRDGLRWILSGNQNESVRGKISRKNVETVKKIFCLFYKKILIKNLHFGYTKNFL